VSIRQRTAPAPVLSRRRLLRGVAGAAVSAPLLYGAAACTENLSPPRPTARTRELTVFFWGGDKRAELTRKALDLYTAAHPGTTFKTVWRANSGYFDVLSTQAAAGNVADLLQIDDNFLSEYAERRILLDLTSYTGDGRLDLTRFPPSLARYGQVNGKQVGVAAAENTPGLIYNRALLKRLDLPEPEIGVSYPDFIAWARQVSGKSGGKVAGTMDPSADYKALWLWLRGQGKELYQGKQLGFGVADLTVWFALWRDARTSGATPGAAVIREANSGDVTRQLVVTGKAATSFMWSNQLPELQKNTKDDLGVTAYPGDPRGQWARASMYWAGFRGTRHADTVVDVISFLVNNAEAGKILGTERGLSSNLEVRTIVEASLGDDKQKRAVAFENEMTPKFGSAPVPPPQGHSRVRSGLVAAAESVQAGAAGPQQAAEKFVSQANAILAG
jgi:multiple sugar transport system substrate-binding protein